jgi:SAM-dependent methyltransferase
VGVATATAFTGVADLYDRFFGDWFFRLWIEHFHRLRRRHGIDVQRACDVACGSGTLVAYLADSGVDVVGVDLSPRMLSLARRKLAGRPGVRLLCQDMRRLRLEAPVDLGTCNYDALNNLLRRADLQAALTGFARALVPGGWCIFDLHLPRGMWRAWGNRTFLEEEGDAALVFQSRYLAGRRRLELRMLGFVPGRAGRYRRFEELHVQRGWTVREARALVERAGLRLEGVYDGTSLRRAGPASESALFVARRPV